MADPVQARTPDVQAIRAEAEREALYYASTDRPHTAGILRRLAAALDQFSQRGETQQAEIADLQQQLANARAGIAGHNTLMRDLTEMPGKEDR